MVVLQFSNPFTGCLFIERRDPKILLFVFQRRDGGGQLVTNLPSRR
jgi:hypothetical protein